MNRFKKASLSLLFAAIATVAVGSIFFKGSDYVIEVGCLFWGFFILAAVMLWIGIYRSD